MDDLPISVPRYAVIRVCQVSRLQTQLLAQAYQRACPQVRQSLADTNTTGRQANSIPQSSTAARVAAGA
jgi:hypothetical protein